MLNIGRRPRRAGQIINRASLDLDLIEIRKKQQNDFVTEVDKAAEDAIIETLKTAYPDHAILAEESGESENESEFKWIIDPLDGTTNFIHGFPYLRIDRARAQGRRHAGCRLRPEQERPVHGHPRPRRVPERPPHPRRPPRPPVGRTGRHRLPVPRKGRPRCLRAPLHRNDAGCTGLRRPGAAALDLERRGRLANVAPAARRVFEQGINVWDMAAGQPITEAGEACRHTGDAPASP